MEKSWKKKNHPSLYVLIAPIHLNVDQLNLDLKIQDVGTV